jgi:hypothetical protein
MKKQQQQRDSDCERFLTARATARYLCQQIGMAGLANDLVPVLFDIQQAHERLVNRSANRMLVQMVKGLRAELITAEQAEQLFQLDESALTELLKRLDVKPQRDLVDHLCGSKMPRSSAAKDMTKHRGSASGVQRNMNELDLIKPGMTRRKTRPGLPRKELLRLHKRVLERVRKMTPEEGFRALVESGIYTPEGKLTKEYGGHEK